MKTLVYVPGRAIYDAAVAGSVCGFNRSTTDHSFYENCLSEIYKGLLNMASSDLKKKIKRNTKNDWRNAYLPVQFLMFHDHIKGKKSEVHARVLLQGNTNNIIDIPMFFWMLFLEKNEE